MNKIKPPRPPRDPEFEERLYQEYDLKGRGRLTISLSALLYASFIFLDWVHAPKPLFSLFLGIRLAVLLAHFVLFVLLGRMKTYRASALIIMTVGAIDVAGI